MMTQMMNENRIIDVFVFFMTFIGEQEVKYG